MPATVLAGKLALASFVTRGTGHILQRNHHLSQRTRFLEHHKQDPQMARLEAVPLDTLALKLSVW